MKKRCLLTFLSFLLFSSFLNGCDVYYISSSLLYCQCFLQKTFHFCTVDDIMYADACFVPRVVVHATPLINLIRSSKNGREIHQPNRLFDSKFQNCI